MIRVTSKYGIDVDEMNYSVVDLRSPEEKKTKAGEKYLYYRPIAFYSSLDGALRKISKLELAGVLSEGDVKLSDLVAMFKEQNDRLESMLAEFK